MIGRGSGVVGVELDNTKAMGRSSKRRQLAVCAVLALSLSSPSAAMLSAMEIVVVPPSPAFVTFTEDAPCPPKVVAARVKRPRARHLRPHPRVVVRRTVSKPRPTLQRLAHRRHLRRPHLRPVANPIVRQRCTVVRREPLTLASFGFQPRPVALSPVVEEPTGGAPIDTAPTPSSGRAPFGAPVQGGAGGEPSRVGGVVTVSALPEPSAWLLIVAGVGALGGVLRLAGARSCVSRRQTATRKSG